jgi:MFS family permease
MTDIHGDEALDPASMLALAQKQQKSVSSQRGAFVAIIMAGYGVALLVGFLSLRFVAGPLAWWTFVGLFVAAIVLSIVLGVRGARGIRSSDEFRGTMYGISWSLAMAGLGALGGGLILQGLDNHLLLLFYSSVYTLLIGVQYFMAGVIWRSIPSLVVGGWLVIVAAVSPYIGYPNNYLVLGIAGGGAFIVLAIVTALRTRALRLSTSRGSATNG